MTRHLLLNPPAGPASSSIATTLRLATTLARLLRLLSRHFDRLAGTRWLASSALSLLSLLALRPVWPWAVRRTLWLFICCIRFHRSFLFERRA